MGTYTKLLALGASGVFVLVLALGVLLRCSEHADLGTYVLAPGVKVHLFVEFDWDCGDGLYYSIWKEGNEIIPTTFLNDRDRDAPLSVSTAASSDGSVLGLWAEGEADGDFPTFVLLHLPSWESWPRLRDNKWLNRYSLLLSEHRDLPVPTYFREAANQQNAEN